MPDIIVYYGLADFFELVSVILAIALVVIMTIICAHLRRRDNNVTNIS